jgi:hypothetical protein
MSWTTVFSDDFNRANGDPANGWTRGGGTYTTNGIVSNVYRAAANSGDAIWIHRSVPSGNWRATVTINNAQFTGLNFGCSSGTSLTSGQAAVDVASATNTQIRGRATNGAGFTVLDGPTNTAGIEFTWQMEWNGTTLTFRKSGVNTYSYAPSWTPTYIRLGSAVFGTANLDNFVLEQEVTVATFTQLERGIRGLNRGLYT